MDMQKKIIDLENISRKKMLYLLGGAVLGLSGSALLINQLAQEKQQALSLDKYTIDDQKTLRAWQKLPKLAQHILFFEAELTSKEQFSQAVLNLAKIVYLAQRKINRLASPLIQLSLLHDILVNEVGIKFNSKNELFFLNAVNNKTLGNLEAVILFKIVGERLNWPLFYVATRDYIFLRWTDNKQNINYDPLANKSFKDAYFIERFYLSKKSMENNTYLVNLPDIFVNALLCELRGAYYARLAQKSTKAEVIENIRLAWTAYQQALHYHEYYVSALHNIANINIFYAAVVPDIEPQQVYEQTSKSLRILNDIIEFDPNDLTAHLEKISVWLYLISYLKSKKESPDMIRKYFNYAQNELNLVKNKYAREFNRFKKPSIFTEGFTDVAKQIEVVEKQLKQVLI